MLILKDFYADWCGPCVAMNPVLEELLPKYSGKIEMVRIDVDQNQAESQKYGVMSIPTLVLEKDGKELDRKIGLQQESTLKEWLDSHL